MFGFQHHKKMQNGQNPPWLKFFLRCLGFSHDQVTAERFKIKPSVDLSMIGFWLKAYCTVLGSSAQLHCWKITHGVSFTQLHQQLISWIIDYEIDCIHPVQRAEVIFSEVLISNEKFIEPITSQSLISLLIKHLDVYITSGLIFFHLFCLQEKKQKEQVYKTSI